MPLCFLCVVINDCCCFFFQCRGEDSFLYILFSESYVDIRPAGLDCEDFFLNCTIKMVLGCKVLLGKLPKGPHFYM